VAVCGRLVIERGKPKERSDKVDEAVSAAQAADRSLKPARGHCPSLTPKEQHLAMQRQ